MILSTISQLLSLFPVETVRELAAECGGLRVAGSTRTLGTAVEVAGGCRVSGRWDFQSGIRNATLVYAVCHLTDGHQALVDANGAPSLRRMLIRPEAGRIIDTWSVLGMRGTGSDDWVLEDVFVPAAQIAPLPPGQIHDQPLYDRRFATSWAWALTAAVALGMGQAARERFIELACRTASAGSKTVLRERPEVQAKLGEAAATLSGARAHLYTAIEAAWRLAREGTPDPTAAIAEARLAITHSVHQAARAVDLIFQAAGTNAIYSRNGLEAYFRDVHTAALHSSSLPQHYATGGKVLLGLDVTDPGW
jgi:alkylation response protein AidB-like acyl-CoA dehydrogenase